MAELELNTRTTPADATGQPSLTTLVSGIMSDAQTLIKQQVEMVRAEFKEDMRRTKDVARYMGIGAALTSVGALFLLIAAAFLLPWLFPETLPTWAGFAIVGGVITVAGLVAVFAGKRILDTYNPLPDKSFNALQENMTWPTNNPRS